MRDLFWALGPASVLVFFLLYNMDSSILRPYLINRALERHMEVSLFIWNIQFLIPEQGFCRRASFDGRLIFVPSRPSSFLRRNAIRQTWGTDLRRNPLNFSLLFFVGKADEGSDQKTLEEESETYGDVVEADFLDSYRNLTLKTAVAFYWISVHCSETRIVIKCDDDTIVLPDGLQDLLEKSAAIQQSNVIVGLKYKPKVRQHNVSSQW